MKGSSKYANKKVLIFQERNESGHAPYIALAHHHSFHIYFHPLISISSTPIQEFRKHKKDLLKENTVIVFANKTSIDHFFSLVKAIKVKLSEDMRYFCGTEQLKNYLQKYIHVKHRKVLCGQKSILDGFSKIKKYKDYTFLFSCSNRQQPAAIQFFKENNLAYKELPTYETTINDLSSLENGHYDLLIFFTPLEVSTILAQCPSLIKEETSIATFGTATTEMVKKEGVRVTISAPRPGITSLANALETYLEGKK